MLKTTQLMFSKEDVAQIEKKGITLEEVEKQIETFKKGNVVVDVREAATPKNGIQIYSDEEQKRFIDLYESKKNELDILKFVPASGAASRMFKAFFKFLEEYDPKEETLHDFLDRKNDKTLLNFFNGMEKLPFYEEVSQAMEENNPNLDEASEDEKKYLFVKAMIGKKGLDLAALPKGLVPFHKYDDHLATAFEEHFYEAADYAASEGKIQLHFTVTKEHRPKFEQQFQKIRKKIEDETGTEIEVSYSYQDPKTDTIAVNEENEAFRKEDGSLFFRPGGHGSLIGNLNNQAADIIFIKNIDNVVVPRFREPMADCKKMLAGNLLKLQQRTFSILKKLNSEKPSDDELDEMFSFMQQELNSGLSYKADELSAERKIEVLKRKLNRPIRVCGMVKNEGEPGGGPFWVNHKNGEISLQIVESAQIDMENYQQSQIVQEATHFNPVDLVCGIKDFKGQIFDFEKFIDPETSFIASKTYKGKNLKALERPGLWNGAMADWITVFVEVSIETFNPVKTVADLLRPRHQVRT